MVALGAGALELERRRECCGGARSRAPGRRPRRRRLRIRLGGVGGATRRGPRVSTRPPGLRSSHAHAGAARALRSGVASFLESGRLFFGVRVWIRAASESLSITFVFFRFFSFRFLSVGVRLGGAASGAARAARPVHQSRRRGLWDVERVRQVRWGVLLRCMVCVQASRRASAEAVARRLTACLVRWGFARPGRRLRAATSLVRFVRCMEGGTSRARARVHEGSLPQAQIQAPPARAKLQLARFAPFALPHVCSESARAICPAADEMGACRSCLSPCAGRRGPPYVDDGCKMADGRACLGWARAV